MEFLQGFSECWWPGPACKVNWTAWAAIGTVGGVLAAILGPMFVGRFRRTRMTVVFAAIFLDELYEAEAAVERICEEFRLPIGPDLPMGPDLPDDWALHGLFMLGSREEFERALAKRRETLTLADKGRYLAEWQDIDSVVAVDVAKAISAVRYLREVMGQRVATTGTVELDWGIFFGKLAATAGAAAINIRVAREACGEMISAHRLSWSARLSTKWRRGWLRTKRLLRQMM